MIMDNNKQFKDRPIVVKLTDDLAKKFINYCDTNGYTISKRVRLLIEHDMNGTIKFETE
jgi:isopropylmalate/homocitrate/citramalate synthase